MGILKTISNSLKSKEEQIFSAWIDDSQENQAAIHSILNKKTVDLTILKGYKDFNTQSAWEKLQSQVDLDTSETKSLPSYYRIAAIGAVLLMSIFAFQQFNGGEQMSTLAMVESGSKLTKEILPDGSVVHLDKQSTIKYDKEKFASNRIVKLSGRAFFEVEKSAGKNFVVEADGVNVEVLGTKFEVNAKQYGNSVTVTEGKVKVFNEISELILLGGDKALINGSNIEKTISKSLNSISWKKGVLDFEETAILKAIEDIEDHFAINIEVDNSSTIADCPFSSSFEALSLNSILDEITKAIGGSFKIENEKVIISGLCK